MVSTLVLVLLDFSKSFEIESEDFGIGIEVVLTQGWLLAFTNKTLSTKHLALSTYEKEMMAILHAIWKWQHYLIGQHFKIYTDHYNLKYLKGQKLSTKVQQKWIEKIMGYDYEVSIRRVLRILQLMHYHDK